jgi:WD40 repeat protein
MSAFAKWANLLGITRIMKWITPPVRLDISQTYRKFLGIPQFKNMLNTLAISLMLAHPVPAHWFEGQNGAASAAFIPNSGYIASVGADGSIIIWDIDSSEPVLQREAHLYSVSHLDQL